MNEKFYNWHNVKSRVDQIDPENIYFKERDIWWCYLGENIGSEQNGKGNYYLRPVLIFKKFDRYGCLVIPLTTQIKDGKTYYILLTESNILRIATLTQLRRIDIRRLHNKIDNISPIELSFIKEKVIELLR